MSIGGGRMIRKLHRMTAVGGLLLLGGCASHHIYVPNYDTVGVAGDPVEVDSLSIFGRKGATNRHSAEVEKYCRKGQLTSVEVRRNALEGLLSVLTLGVVSPVRILFFCGKEPIAGQ